MVGGLWSLPALSGLRTWTLSLTGNPSCPRELLVSTALGDVAMQAVFALGLFCLHTKQKTSGLRHSDPEGLMMGCHPRGLSLSTQ